MLIDIDSVGPGETASLTEVSEPVGPAHNWKGCLSGRKGTFLSPDSGQRVIRCVWSYGWRWGRGNRSHLRTLMFLIKSDTSLGIQEDRMVRGHEKRDEGH